MRDGWRWGSGDYERKSGYFSWGSGCFVAGSGYRNAYSGDLHLNSGGFVQNSGYRAFAGDATAGAGTHGSIVGDSPYDDGSLPTAAGDSICRAGAPGSVAGDSPAAAGDPPPRPRAVPADPSARSPANTKKPFSP